MKTKITWFDRLMAAVTFAEAGMDDDAIAFVHDTEKRAKKKSDPRR